MGDCPGTYLYRATLQTTLCGTSAILLSAILAHALPWSSWGILLQVYNWKIAVFDLKDMGFDRYASADLIESNKSSPSLFRSRFNARSKPWPSRISENSLFAIA